MNDIAIIAGAGPAGLTAALELLKRSSVKPVLFELESQPGGISRTINYRGNRMDIGGHRFFSKSDWVMNWWQDILPVAVDQIAEAEEFHLKYQNRSRTFTPRAVASSAENAVMLVRPRLSRIYYRRRFFDYPLKLSANTFGNLGVLETARIGASYAASCLFKRSPETSLEDFFVNRFGQRLYHTFFKSYTEKVWGVPCDEISADWGAQRIRGLSVTRALVHALRSVGGRSSDVRQQGVETSLIERFLYPKFGPGQMWEEVAARVQEGGGEVNYRHRIVAIHRNGGSITGVDVRDLATGNVRRIDCKYFISTMPLNDLVAQLSPANTEIATIARALPHRDFMTAGLLVRRMKHGPSRAVAAPGSRVPDNWIYVQEPDVRLGRVQVFNNWSPHLVCDPSTVWLGLEYFCKEGDQLWGQKDPEFLDFAARELAQIGLVDRADVLDGTVVRVPKAYPAYFGEYRNIGQIREWLEQFPNLFAIGRNGMHRYNNQDHSMLTARAAVDCIVAGSQDKAEIWAVNTDDDYHEVAKSDRARVPEAAVATTAPPPPNAAARDRCPASRPYQAAGGGEA
jgi:protoporphyrinogen oxidase